MKQQEDSPERRDMSRSLVAVAAGLADLADVQSSLSPFGFSLRMIESGALVRFILFDDKGRVFDHWEFHSEGEGILPGESEV